MAWDIEAACVDRRYAGYLPGLVLTVVIGPLCWIALIRKRHDMPEVILAFLVASYRKGFRGWEVSVLVRKMLWSAIMGAFFYSQARIFRVSAETTVN